MGKIKGYYKKLVDDAVADKDLVTLHKMYEDNWKLLKRYADKENYLNRAENKVRVELGLDVDLEDLT